MLEKILDELTKRINIVKTLSTNKENRITRFDEKGIYVQTESSKNKYVNGFKEKPYDFISYDFIIEGWNEFVSVRNATSNDFQKTKGRSSFLMAFFSSLPFVEKIAVEQRTSISLREFQTDDLPNVSYKRVIEFLDDMVSERVDPSLLSEQFEGNLYRIKSRGRQDARLLGFINEDNEINQFQLNEYKKATNKDTYLKGILLNLGYFRVVLICLDLIKNLSKNDKKEALVELGRLIVRNSLGENLMVESVAKERTNYLLSWLENTGLIDENWNPVENYFETLSKKEQIMKNNIRNYFLKVMNGYLAARKASPGVNPEMGTLLKHDIPNELSSLPFINPQQYVINGSAGTGRWASIPWVAIMSRTVTTSTRRGYYLVYLFSEDMTKVYLTIAQGVEDTPQKEMLRIKEEIKKFVPEAGKAKTDENIYLGESQKARQYAQSTSAYIKYEIDDIPDDSILAMDLEEMINIYENYLSSKNGYVARDTTEVIHEKNTIKLNDKELIDHIYSYIKSKGFYYKKDEVINLFLSLKTKPFVILSGISGTGKTKMVQWFAESVGATEENGQFSLIPIRPDWNDGSDLLGYVDIKGAFIEGPLTKVIRKAIEQPDLPYFVLLDEMNLARVEYYFSDILSVMESRKWKDNRVVSSNLLSEEIVGIDLKLPNNLYIIGTVNMDETTHPFSKKVLDRANTIEFNRVELTNFEYLHDSEELDPVSIGHESFASFYLHLKDVYQKYTSIVERVTNDLVKINTALQLTNAHVGYRVRDEICFYMVYNEEGKLMDFEEAMDHCILQKVLPRISGSDSRVERLLKSLYQLFTNKQYQEDQNIIDQDLNNAIYPLSGAKVAEMLRRLEEDGFTSFWIA